MYELNIPQGVRAELNVAELKITGKLGSTVKRFNPKYVSVKINGNKIFLDASPNKKLTKKSTLAVHSFEAELRATMESVEKGIEKKMKILYAHFPMTIEIKGTKFFIKNMFGERVPRSTSIIGNTKVEVKGQEVHIRGVDQYDVGQTIANIRKICYARGYDTRVFQDGVYLEEAEE